ncbi:MAG: histone deacetylase family protein [Alphaproteobacteria bacterium]|nr:histone deacetylase family protein [Alphaproteobacteria bacterium]
MKVVYPEAQALHQPDFYYIRGNRSGAREVPERAEVLLRAARSAGHEIVAAESFGATPREAVHDRDYLAFLETAHERWQALENASPQIMPSIHPVRHMQGRPAHIVGQVGWFIADTSCPIGRGTWQAACASADAAIHAARLVQGGERAAYALSRPPGHHCYSDLAGGFCYLNNIAIAAEDMRREFDRLAIIDIDVHHGNGTQGIFYRRDDVFFASVHADPNAFYPFFAGYASETGDGPGKGTTLNKPLPLGSGDGDFMAAVDEILAAVREFAPAAVLVSLGFDASEDDPFAGLAVTTAGFGQVGTAIARLGLPLVLVQEGGYLSRSLGDNLVSFIAGVDSAL